MKKKKAGLVRGGAVFTNLFWKPRGQQRKKRTPTTEKPRKKKTGNTNKNEETKARGA